MVENSGLITKLIVCICKQIVEARFRLCGPIRQEMPNGEAALKFRACDRACGGPMPNVESELHTANLNCGK